MDTSGLASSLSLAGFLTAFAYLSLAKARASPERSRIRSPQYLSRLLLTLQLLKLSAVVAVVLSTQALLLSQSSPGLGLNALVALGALASLVLIDRSAALLSTRHPLQVSFLTSPLVWAIAGLLTVSRARDTASGAPGNGTERNGDTSEHLDPTPLVFTEEGQVTLDPRERLMIRSIIRLDESTAREVMVPRVDVIAVSADTPLTEVANRMLEFGHSRLPVYGKTIDDVIGVVYSRDLLPFLARTEEHSSLEKIIRPAFFIPESKRLDELLRELQERRVQMALVVDEYGGIEGLVTLEDLMEEIVGEIEDEFSRTVEPQVVPLANGDIIVDSRVTLDYLSDLFSKPIEHEDVDTVGGLVFSALGKMPQVGDQVVHDGLRIEVVSLLGRRIRKLKLSKTESPAADPQ